MRKFFACVRPNNSAPSSMELQAEDVPKAIRLMLDKYGAKSTSELYEYDLLEIRDNNSYIPVAQKFAKRGREPTPEVIEAVVVNSETIYHPYTNWVAA